MIDSQQIREWKKLIVENPKRLEDEKLVIEKYGTMFHPNNLDKLTKDDFRSFLLIKNNRHWDGIHRQVNMITSDMDKLSKGLKILLDESKPIKERLDILFPHNKPNYIKGLGRAIVTPILLMVHPEKYGVFNTKSEEGLKELELLPSFKKKSFSEKYIAVNDVLINFASEYGLTLWQVDEIVGWIVSNPPIGSDDVVTKTSVTEIAGEIVEDYTDFGLEAHLEEFIVENWEKLDLGKNYDILSEDGDLIGQQYITPIGRIDLLAKSKDGKEWLILELKKGRSSDAVTGQILRYIGWTEDNLAESGQTVRGIIILGDIDDKLRYSVKTISNVNLLTYQVDFKLNDDN